MGMSSDIHIYVSFFVLAYFRLTINQQRSSSQQLNFERRPLRNFIVENFINIYIYISAMKTTIAVI